MLEKQPLQEGTFLRGCRDGALDENGRHLNGVMLVRRADVLGVLGYDERMRGYGYDDTDLYHRLSAGRNLSAKCLSFTHMRHSEESHGERGLTHIHHILHRRATTELFKLCTRQGSRPPNMAMAPRLHAACLAECKLMVSLIRQGSRPPRGSYSPSGETAAAATAVAVAVTAAAAAAAAAWMGRRARLRARTVRHSSMSSFRCDLP